MVRPVTPLRLRQVRARRQVGLMKPSPADDFVGFTVDEPPEVFHDPSPKASQKKMLKGSAAGKAEEAESPHNSRPGSVQSQERSGLGSRASQRSQGSRETTPDTQSRLGTNQSRRSTASGTSRAKDSEDLAQRSEAAVSVGTPCESPSPEAARSPRGFPVEHFPARMGAGTTANDTSDEEDEESDDENQFSGMAARQSLLSRSSSIMPSGTRRSIILPEVLDEKLKDRFLRTERQEKARTLPHSPDPATIMMSRLKKTRYISRMAKLGDGIYGRQPTEQKAEYVFPPLADLGNAVDDCNSDEEDEFLLTDDLVGNLTAPPLTAARMHILNTKTEDLNRPMTTSYSQWPPRVASPSRPGPLHFSHTGDRLFKSIEVYRDNKILSGSMNYPIPPATPSSHLSEEHSRPGTQETVGSRQTADSSLNNSIRSTQPFSRSRQIGHRLDRTHQRLMESMPGLSSGLMADIPVRNGTAPASVPTLKEMRDSMGKLVWVGHKQWKHENQERIRTAFSDVTMEETFDSTMMHRRLESRPFRHCYDKRHLLSNHVTHRTMAHAAEPGPEVGHSSLARHYAQTSKQAESEVVVFRRRFDTLLAASGPQLTSINLSACLSGDRNFRLLLVTLPLYPSLRELIVRNNGLDDGYMDVLVDTLVEMASITSLDISCNRLSWVSASKLGTMLQRRVRDLGGQKMQLETLKMNENNIGNRGVEILGEALPQARKLHTLCLSKCGIGAAGGKKLGQLLSEALSVKELDLSWNELGVQGAAAIASGVGFSPLLKRLNLSHNFFGDGASEEIAEGLSQTGGLCHIDLSSNFLGMKTCVALGRALMASTDTSKHTLQNIILDNNPCTLYGASMLGEFLSKSPLHDLHISMQGCSFEKGKPKRAFSPDDAEGQYNFELENPEERNQAIELLKARNLQVAGAWHVSMLNGKLFQPLGPWDAPPPPPPEEAGGDTEGVEGGQSKGEDKKGKPKDGKKKDGEEEEKLPDPWDPLVALPSSGDLYVEFRNVCMLQLSQDSAAQIAELSDIGFQRIWSSHQTASTTDEWRVGYIRAVCTRHWLSVDQVVSVLKSFTQPKDKIKAAFCMFWRLLSYKDFFKVHSALPEATRNEFYSSIGISDHLDLRLPMGHYKLDMSMRIQNCVAHILQFLWVQEIAEEICIGEQRSCWRNVTLNGKAVSARPNSLLPSAGVLELDFVSGRHPSVAKRSVGLLLDATFAYMLEQLTSSQSTMLALGPDHFLEQIKHKQRDIETYGDKPEGALGKGVSRKGSSKRSMSRKKSSGKGKSRTNSSASVPSVNEPNPGANQEEAKANAKPEEDRQRPAEPVNAKTLLQQLSLSLPKTREVHPPDFVIRTLEDAASHGQVHDPKQALAMLIAVYSHFTIDIKQTLILLQCFNLDPEKKLELLVKLYCSLENRDGNISSIVMFGLKPEEREKIIHSIGILSIVSKRAPNFEYKLSMRQPDQRYCLYMLLKLSVSGGAIDTRMLEPMRVNGELVARRRFHTSQLWHALLGDRYWDMLNLHMQGTNSRLGNMWQWLELGKTEHRQDPLKGLAATPRAKEELASAPPAELELEPEPEPDPEEEERAEAEATAAAEALADAQRLEAGEDAPAPKPPPPETEEEKEARRAKKKERELKKLRLGTVTFTYDVTPEVKLKALCLVASDHWRIWAKKRRETRLIRAAATIVEWYRNKKQERELADMQQLLEMQELEEHRRTQGTA